MTSLCALGCDLAGSRSRLRIQCGSTEGWWNRCRVERRGHSALDAEGPIWVRLLSEYTLDSPGIAYSTMLVGRCLSVELTCDLLLCETSKGDG